MDHYGPDEVASSGGMSVAPHPHTGLRTVSWLFAGEIEHRDSAGNQAMVRPGEVDLMTAGHGISHLRSPPRAPTCCTAPSSGWRCPTRPATPGPASSTTPPSLSAGRAGRPASSSARSSVRPPGLHAHPLLGAEIMLAPGATLQIDVDTGFERGVLVDTGVVDIADSAGGAGTETKPGELASSRPATTASG